MKSFVLPSSRRAMITTNPIIVSSSSRLCSSKNGGGSSSLNTTTLSQDAPPPSSSAASTTHHQTTTTIPSPRELLYRERYSAYYHHLCQRAAHFDHTRRRPFGKTRVQSEAFLKLLANKKDADERLYNAIQKRRSIEEKIIDASDSKLDFIPSLPPGWWGNSQNQQQPKKVVKTRKQTPLGRFTHAAMGVVSVPSSLLNLFGIRPLYLGMKWVVSLVNLRSVRKQLEHLSNQLDAARLLGEESGNHKLPYHYYDVQTNTRLHPRPQTLQSVAFGSSGGSTSFPLDGSSGGAPPPLSHSFLKETALSPALQAEINTFFHLATINESDLPHNNTTPSHLKATSNLCNDLVFSSVEAESGVAIADGEVVVVLDEVIIPEEDEERVDALLDTLDNMVVAAPPTGTALTAEAAIKLAKDLSSNKTNNNNVASVVIKQPSAVETPTKSVSGVEVDNNEKITTTTATDEPSVNSESSADEVVDVEEDDTATKVEEEVVSTSNAVSSFDKYKQDALREVLAAVAAHKKRSARLEHNYNNGDEKGEVVTPLKTQQQQVLEVKVDSPRVTATPSVNNPNDRDSKTAVTLASAQSGSAGEVESNGVGPGQVVVNPQSSESSQQDFKRQVFQLQMLWYDSTAFFPPAVTKAFFKAGTASTEMKEGDNSGASDNDAATPPLSPEESALLFQLATISSNPTLNSSYGPPLNPLGYPLRLYLDVPHSHNILANFIEGACRDISVISQRQFNLDDDTAVQRGLGAFAKLQFYFPPTNVRQRQQAGNGSSDADSDLAAKGAKKTTSNLTMPPHTHILSLLADSTNALKRCVAETMGPEVRPNPSIQAGQGVKVWSPIQLIPGVPWEPIVITPGATVPHKLGVEYSALLKSTCVAPPTASGVVSTAGNRYSLCPVRALGSDVPLATLRSEHSLSKQQSEQQQHQKWRWTPNEGPGIPAPTYRPRTPPEVTLEDVTRVVSKLSQSLRSLNLLTTNRFGQRLDDSFDKDRVFPEIKKPESFEVESSEVATIATSWPLSYILSAPTQGSTPDPLNPVSPAPNFVFPHASDIYTFSTPRQQQRLQEQQNAAPSLLKGTAAPLHTNAPPKGFTSTYAVTVVSMSIGDVANSMIGITTTLSSLIQYHLHNFKRKTSPPVTTTVESGEEKAEVEQEAASGQSSKKGRRGRRSPQRPRKSPIEGHETNDDDDSSDEVAPSNQAAKDAHTFASMMKSKKKKIAGKNESPSTSQNAAQLQSEIDGVVDIRPSYLSPQELERLSLPHCWRSNLLRSTTLGIESALLDSHKNKRRAWSTNHNQNPISSKSHTAAHPQRRRSSSYLASPDVVDRAAKRAVETLINDRVKKASIKRLPFNEGPPAPPGGDAYDGLYRDVKQRLGSFELEFRAASRYALNEVKK